MAMVATDLKGMLSITIKSRHDSHSDQYNRIFMVKLLLVSSVVMGISWYQDSIQCIVPDTHKISGGFVSSTCWIQGVFVYKQLRSRVDEVAYFGIPKNVDDDGYLSDSPTKELCATVPRLGKKPKASCVAMDKTFFLQYQYMPFLIAALSILYYFPYLAFKTANSDLIGLKDTVKGDDPNAEKIAKYYFGHKGSAARNNQLRIIFNILIKLLYLVANLATLLGLDSVLNGEFVNYGNQWVKWSKLNNTIAHDYMGLRDHPKPGNLLLPPFGFCEVYESSKDIRTTLGNKHKFVCELSQNILYQYALIVLWFAIIIGIVVSVVGFVLLLVHYCIGFFGLQSSNRSGLKLLKSLSFREKEYLEFIRKRNIGLYGEVLEKLKENLEANEPNQNGGYNPGNDSAPMIPMKDRRFSIEKPPYA